MEKNLQALTLQEKIAVWSERIADCRSSGIGVKAWCEGNGVSSSSYYKWQKKLFFLAAQNEPQFAEVRVAPPARFRLLCVWRMFPWTSIQERMLRQQPCC